MTSAPLTQRETDDALAAEYVLGVQDLAERTATEKRIKRDTDFAALVTAWEGRLEGLNDEFNPEPAPNLLPALETRLFPRTDQRSASERRRATLWRRAYGAAVGFALVVVWMAFLAPLKPSTLAVLATADARLSYEVRYFGNELQVTRLAGVPAVAGRVHELWLIAPGAAAPVSLGILDGPELRVTYPRPPDGWTLAVSIEPAGGSRYGTPTGPVILTAEIGA